MKAACRPAEGGFTLLEVLVAFALVAFVVAAVMQLYSGGMRSTSLAEQRVVATMLAQSKLAEMAAAPTFTDQRTAGVSREGYRWQAEVRKFAEMAGETQQAQPVLLYQLAVTVGWGAAERPRTVRLTTLRINAPEQDQEGAESGR